MAETEAGTDLPVCGVKFATRLVFIGVRQTENNQKWAIFIVTYRRVGMEWSRPVVFVAAPFFSAHCCFITFTTHGFETFELTHTLTNGLLLGTKKMG